VVSALLAAASQLHWGWNVLLLLTIPALVALNGLFVAAEFALVAVRRTRVEELQQQGVAGANSVAYAIGHLDRSIAATQLGITLASIGLGFVGEPALARLLMPVFENWPEPWNVVSAHSFAVVISFSCITFLHVVFGELIPKTLALQIPDKTALWVTRPLLWFAWLTRPIIVVMNGTGFIILRWLGYNVHAEVNTLVHSVEELSLLIGHTEEAGMIDADQAEYVQNVFELSEKPIRECMVPREKMGSLELNTPPDKILEIVRQGAHTRLPVYEGQLDNIVGIVNTKDLFYLFSLQGVVILGDALYPALYLKPDETMANALRLFRKAHRPMALVRDDDGKIHGLITLEDVLEEIVGDIEDEHDQPRPRRIRVTRKIIVKPPAPKPVLPEPPKKEAERGPAA